MSSLLSVSDIEIMCNNLVMGRWAVVEMGNL